MQNIIIEPFKLSYVDTVLTILFESFEAKFKHIVLLPKDKLKQLFFDIFYLNNQLENDGHFVAICNEKVVGVILLNYKNQKNFETTHFPTIKFSKLILKYGLCTTLRFIFALNLLSSNKIADSECYVEHIAILKEFRGKRIGSQLLSYTENFAKGLPHIREFSLHVAKSNENALKLYQKLGFVNQNHKLKTGFFLKFLIGESSFYYMNKDIV